MSSNAITLKVDRQSTGVADLSLAAQRVCVHSDPITLRSISAARHTTRRSVQPVASVSAARRRYRSYVNGRKLFDPYSAGLIKKP